MRFLFFLFLITLIVGFIAIAITKLSNHKTIKVVFYIFVFLLLAYGVILLLQPSNYIKFNTDFSNISNTHLHQ